MDVRTLHEQSQGLLSGPLKHAKNAALAALLVPLAVAATDAQAQVAVSERSSRVDGTVTFQPGDGNYLYEFTVHNTTPCGGSGSGSGGCSGQQIVDWELPFFSTDDFDLLSITSPVGWRHEIIANPTDPNVSTDYYNDGGEGSFYGQYAWDYVAANDPLLDPLQGGDPGLYGSNPGVFDTPPFIIHWYTWDGAECFNPDFELTQDELDVGFCSFASSPVVPINPGGSLDGFSFVSAYSSRNAPYIASWFFEPPTQGDPPIGDSGFASPLSPARLLAQGDVSAVPEPEMLGLLGLGILGLAAARRRRRD